MPEPIWAGNEPARDQGPPGPPGPPGASSLTDLTDVTGDPAPGNAPVNDGTTNSPWTRVVTEADFAALTAVEWHEIDLPPGLVNFGNGYAPARYSLTPNNVVYLEGHIGIAVPIDETNAGLVLAQLPPECSPGYRLVFNSPNDGAQVARIDVHDDCTVSFEGFFGGQGNAQFLSLNQISYRCGADSILAAQRFGG